MITIDLLRHGALEGGVRYRGLVDDPLTTLGRSCMDRAWKQMFINIDHIICSPLSRCSEPAHEWSDTNSIPISIDHRIQELNYGDWDGLTTSEIDLISPGLLSQWRSNPEGMTPPNGESMETFVRRIREFLVDLVHSYSDQHLLLVTHSGTIRILITLALQAPIKTCRHIDMPYGCWSRLQLNSDGNTSLVFHAKDY